MTQLVSLMEENRIASRSSRDLEVSDGFSFQVSWKRSFFCELTPWQTFFEQLGVVIDSKADLTESAVDLKYYVAVLKRILQDITLTKFSFQARRYVMILTAQTTHWLWFTLRLSRGPSPCPSYSSQWLTFFQLQRVSGIHRCWRGSGTL
jgi:hypothetical protein